MNELCQVSNSIFLRHEWTTLGPCRRCGEPFPKLAPPEEVETEPKKGLQGELFSKKVQTA